MKNGFFKQLLPHIYAIAIIIVVLLAYFYPTLEGKIIKQDDIVRHKAISKEIADFREKHHEEPLWTNALFGGMPAFQISVLYKNNLVQYIHRAVIKSFPNVVGIVFLLMLGFYLFLINANINRWISLIFSIAFGFSSFFIISLAAGHNSKLGATAYMAFIMLGIILAYRKNKWLGASLTALFTALQLNSNHFQITYYTLFVIGLYVIIEFIYAYREKALKPFFATSSILLLAGLLSLGPNISRLWSTYEYAKETIRGGKSELTNPDKKQSSGLDIDYAMSWSYGIGETFTLLIPDFYGGSSSGSLDETSATYKALTQRGVPKVQAKNYVKHLPLYWGDQPFTSGPVYVGAILVFLFVLALFIVKSRLKWWLLSITVLSIVLAWGKNFLIINELMFDYFPFYNKFRAPSMILIIADFAIPAMAALALHQIYKDGSVDFKKVLNAFYITGGITLFFALLGGSFFDFSATSDTQLQQQGWPVDALIADRAAMLKSSAWKAFILIALATTLIWAYVKQKISANTLFIVLGLLIIGDLWSEDKKYLNKDHFISKRETKQLFTPDAADQAILADKSLDYRVYNLTVNPFTDAMTSYFHKSVGGYHGAKLIRYQDLIERQLSKNNMEILNMLNTKYFIVPDKQNGGRMAQMNPGALGNAWFVNSIKWAKNADEEMAVLTNLKPAEEVVIDERYKTHVKTDNITKSGNQIKIVSYRPNHLTYEANVTSDNAFAVFSEIYYEGGNHDWKTYIDGKETNHIRVNYVLRGMNIPKGTHTIEFKFLPDSYYKGETYSLLFSIIIFLFVATSIWLNYKQSENKK